MPDEGGVLRQSDKGLHLLKLVEQAEAEARNELREQEARRQRRRGRQG